MGLDQYLRAKTTKREYKEPTGACSGLFPVAPEDDGMVEIGYWRKAYDQNEVILNNSTQVDEDDDTTYKLEKEGIKNIIAEAKRILETHTFDEEGYDITEDANDYNFYYSTYSSEWKWENTIEFFEEALKILEEDKDAEIYYVMWY